MPNKCAQRFSSNTISILNSQFYSEWLVEPAVQRNIQSISSGIRLFASIRSDILFDDGNFAVGCHFHTPNSNICAFHFCFDKLTKKSNWIASPFVMLLKMKSYAIFLFVMRLFWHWKSANESFFIVKCFASYIQHINVPLTQLIVSYEMGRTEWRKGSPFIYNMHIILATVRQFIAFAKPASYWHAQHKCLRLALMCFVCLDEWSWACRWIRWNAVNHINKKPLIIRLFELMKRTWIGSSINYTACD